MEVHQQRGQRPNHKNAVIQPREKNKRSSSPKPPMVHFSSESASESLPQKLINLNKGLLLDEQIQVKYHHFYFP